MKSILQITALAVNFAGALSLAAQQPNQPSNPNPIPKPNPPARNTPPASPASPASAARPLSPPNPTLPAPGRDPFIVKSEKPSAPPENEDAPAVNDVLLRIEYFSMPRLQAREWQSKLEAAALYKAVSDAADEDKEVKLENFVILRTRSYNRIMAESVAEFACPTDFDPPQIPQTIGGAALTAIKNAKKEGAADGRALWPMTYTTPTTFTTRSPGSTMEVDPVLLESRTFVDLNYAFETSDFDGWEWMDGSQDVPQARFNSEKAVSVASIPLGIPSYLGTLSSSPHKRKDAKVDQRTTLIFCTPSLASNRAAK